MIVAILLSIELVKTFHMRVDLTKKDFWKVAVLHLRLRNCTEAEEIVDLVGRTWRILGETELSKSTSPLNILKKEDYRFPSGKRKKCIASPAFSRMSFFLQRETQQFVVAKLFARLYLQVLCYLHIFTSFVSVLGFLLYLHSFSFHSLLTW